MELASLKEAVPGLADKSHNDKILIFGWWLHIHKAKAAFTGADITKCYTDLHFSAPSSFGGYIQNLIGRKDLLKVAAGYKLENKIREKLDAAYGTSEITVKVTDLLTGLVASIPDMAERAYYKEALICYKYGSLRAAVVMTWNIGFHISAIMSWPSASPTSMPGGRSPIRACTGARGASASSPRLTTW